LLHLTPQPVAVKITQCIHAYQTVSIEGSEIFATEPIMVDCCAKSSSTGIPPHTADYFYGRISRQETENHLAHGHDGLFLLRWCINHANAYGLAVHFEHK